MPRATRKTSKTLSRRKSQKADPAASKGANQDKILTAEGWKRLMMRRSSKSTKSK